MPRGFDFPDRAESCRPRSILIARLLVYDGISRLAPGVTEEDARQSW
jgi:hypothetical protein